MISTEFESWKLHDALLDWVEILWEKKLCRFYVHAFVEKGKDATPHILELENVTAINVPHEEPWGPSFFINKVKFESGVFQIQMQSGDVIAVTSTGYSFTPSNHTMKADEK